MKLHRAMFHAVSKLEGPEIAVVVYKTQESKDRVHLRAINYLKTLFICDVQSQPNPGQMTSLQAANFFSYLFNRYRAVHIYYDAI